MFVSLRHLEGPSSRNVLQSEFGQAPFKLFWDLGRNNIRDLLQNKSIFRRLWLSLPKYTCWKIWLARKISVFKEEKFAPIELSMQQNPNLRNF
jgi:hypothetical protein